MKLPPDLAAKCLELAGEKPAAKPRREKVELLPASHEPGTAVWIVPLKVDAGDNSRGQRSRVGRAGHERRVTSRALGGAGLPDLAVFAWLASRGEIVTVTLTRLGGRQLDDDNCVSAMKYVRDVVAMFFGQDDGPSSPLRWEYRAEPGGAFGVRIELTTKEE